MSDAALFIGLFGGLFVIRLIVATVVFLWILPDGDRCPCCDAETLRVESRGALKVMPWFRSSWCYECDWHGLHRVRRTTCLPFPQHRPTIRMGRCQIIRQGGLVRHERGAEMRRKLWLYLGLGLAMALPQQRIDAQAASRPRMGEIQPDSAAWRPLLVYIIAKLSHNVLDAAIDTTPRPWKMSFPSTGADWPAIEAHLRTALRARDVVAGDSVVYELRIHDLTVRADTARAQVITSVAWDCPGGARQGGYTNRDDVFVFRFSAWRSESPSVWSAARSAGVLHGDRFGCPERRP